MRKKFQFASSLLLIAGLSVALFGSPTANAQQPDFCQKGCFKANQRCLQRTENEVQCRVQLNQCLNRCRQAEREEGE